MTESSAEAELLARAEIRCRQQGASLTPIRREVLALLGREPNGMKAYDLLEQMRQTRPNAAPPTVYRALDFLIAQGLAHRIGRLNLFVACRHSSHPSPALFLLCPHCNAVSELQDPDVSSRLFASLQAAGYRLDSPEVEISAVCPRCTGQHEALQSTE